MDRNLAQRIGFAVAAIPFALVIVWYGGWLLVGFLMLVGILGTRELYALFRRSGGAALEAPGIIGAHWCRRRSTWCSRTDRKSVV